MKDIIFISIASYRDTELINTVRNCFDNAKYKDRLFFSVFSQDSDESHPDLSFIPDNQINYLKSHWSQSLGVCWARKIITKNIFGKYFLQIDSHSRFKKDWDTMIIDAFDRSSKFWGSRIILTGYPDEYEILKDGSEKFNDSPTLKKLNAIWQKETKTVQADFPWGDVINTESGDEIFFLSANSLFTLSDIMKELPYDEKIYFTGEEASIALRAYTRGIRLISPPVKYMYSHYDRSAYGRIFHWDDHKDWWRLNSDSYDRISMIMSGNQSLGEYGIKSKELFDQYQKITGIDLVGLYA